MGERASALDREFECVRGREKETKRERARARERERESEQVCVCERESERQRKRDRKGVWVCVCERECVCVCERETQRERNRQRETKKKRERERQRDGRQTTLHPTIPLDLERAHAHKDTCTVLVRPRTDSNTATPHHRRYCSHPDIKLSDHRPVSASFVVSLQKRTISDPIRPVFVVTYMIYAYLEFPLYHLCCSGWNHVLAQ